MARARRGRGEGGVFQRKDGGWSAEVSMGYGGDGRRRRKTLYGDTKKEVLKKLDEFRQAASSGTLPAAGAMTVGQLLDRWLDDTHTGLAVRTHEERQDLIERHVRPHLARVRLADLTKLHVAGLYSTLRGAKVGAATIRRAADALAIALNYAVKLDLIRVNPASAKAVPKPKVPKREMVPLTEPQCRRLLAAARGKPVATLVATALGSGCRQGELLALGWEDVDLAAGTLRVRRSLARTRNGFVLKEPKSEASRRTITLPGFALTALREHKARADKAELITSPVFCTRTGGYLDRKNVLRAFKAVVAATNAAHPDVTDPILASVRFHDCRHTAASLLLSAGMSLRAVSRRLGHAKPEMTLRVYAHCLPTDDERLSEELDRVMG
jgi:integrase